ncbi:MAG: hypothetical protein U0326_10100 [Polyangiales bacterium]
MRKGFVLAGVRTLAEIRAIEALWDRLGRPSSVSLIVPGELDPSAPNPVYLDTGLRWLCSKAERTRARAELAASARLLARAASQRNAALLANGTPYDSPSGTRFASVADEHILEVFDDDERAALSDTLRASMHVLVALAARSAVTAQGLDPFASTRLFRTAHLDAAPLLRAGGAKHLAHVERLLHRRGIKSFAHVDIDPRGGGYEGAKTILVRALDGQILADTTCSHALLLLALSLRAREVIEASSPPSIPSPDELAAARSLAVRHGLNARFEFKGTGRRDAARESQRASQAALALIESLDWEFRALDASFDEEIAPLALGLSLRRLGWSTPRSENDALAEALRTQNNPALLRDAAASQQLLGQESLAKVHAARFEAPQQMVRALWAERLGARQEPTSATEMFLTRILAPDTSWEAQREALLGLHRETLCFDLQRLARRHLANPANTLLTAFEGSTNQYTFNARIDRQQVAGYLNIVQRGRAVGLRLEAPSAEAADETETRLFGAPLPGMIAFRLARAKVSDAKPKNARHGPREGVLVVSHYLLIGGGAS